MTPEEWEADRCTYQIRRYLRSSAMKNNYHWHVHDQLPGTLKERMTVLLIADAHMLVVRAEFTDKAGRKFECKLNSNFTIPPEFIAHLCVVL
jgi:hypothetical protein